VAQASRGRRRPERPHDQPGWERYAQDHEGPAPLGDEWSDPAAIGMDVPADEIVPTLDRELFAPFLGTCDTIVELGPGGGRFTSVLLPKCRRLLAADTSATMLAMLRRRFAGDDRLECVPLDGQGLCPIADASADAVFAFDVFVHLPQWDAFNYLREIRRVLRPGGKAVIHHGNVFSDLGWANFVSELPVHGRPPQTVRRVRRHDARADARLRRARRARGRRVPDGRRPARRDHVPSEAAVKMQCRRP
jgi:SAM-dependent methyltransferase